MELVDLMVHDGLMDPNGPVPVGKEADLVAREHEVTREELDKVAYESHMRATRASDKGLFLELEPIDIAIDGERVRLVSDEGVRPDTSLEALGKLKPAFTPEGPHTAGNSSQLSDGAAALLLTTEEYAKELGLRPIARVLNYAWHMMEPWRFTEAPVFVIRKLMGKLGWSLDDVDVFEVNEAFAVVNVLVNKELGIPYDRLNILGGAIALGHPLGASGARIVTTLISALRHRGGRRGIAALCHNVGGATAIGLELI
jgi:acetyl-CoA C-acetyltransferase